MKDFYKATRECVDKYNQIINKCGTYAEELTDDEDEYLTNFCLYLAHAIVKDTGEGQIARDELRKVANIIIDVID